jgi:hypothetical protein
VFGQKDLFVVQYQGILLIALYSRHAKNLSG